MEDKTTTPLMGTAMREDGIQFDLTLAATEVMGRWEGWRGRNEVTVWAGSLLQILET